MTEVFFYHLQAQPLEKVLPLLLQKTLERGWRALVRTSSLERAKALDDHLWTFDEASFLPHGIAGEPDAMRQPILIAPADGEITATDALFLVDGAPLPDPLPDGRVIVMFDGVAQETLAAARQAWRDVTGAGHQATYWQQDQDGRWQKRG